MYGLGDEDLAAAYSAEDLAKDEKTPRYPTSATGRSKCRLNRVARIMTQKAGALFEFKFTVRETTDEENLIAGKQYTLGFFPGKSPVDYKTFWRNITPALRAVTGYDGAAKDFDAVEQLGDLNGMCKEDADLDLDLPFYLTSKQEPCKPNKEGVVKHKNADGTPKIFQQNYFDILIEEDSVEAAGEADPAS